MLYLHGPLGDGVQAVGGPISTVYQTVSKNLGPIITVLGGGRAAWQASRGKDFSGELIGAIAGIILIAASQYTGGQLSSAATQASNEVTAVGHQVGLVLGLIVTVIGVSWAAWDFTHGKAATSKVVCAVIGICIAAVAKV